jgi:hypothetical protein
VVGFLPTFLYLSLLLLPYFLPHASSLVLCLYTVSSRPSLLFFAGCCESFPCVGC